jgi:hypothetical protein
MRPRPEQAVEVTIPDDRNPDGLRTEANRPIPFAQDRENDFDLRSTPDTISLRGGELRSVRDGRLDHEPRPAHAQPVDAHFVFGVRGLKAHEVSLPAGPQKNRPARSVSAYIPQEAREIVMKIDSMRTCCCRSRCGRGVPRA